MRNLFPVSRFSSFRWKIVFFSFTPLIFPIIKLVVTFQFSVFSYSGTHKTVEKEDDCWNQIMILNSPINMKHSHCAVIRLTHITQTWFLSYWFISTVHFGLIQVQGRLQATRARCTVQIQTRVTKYRLELPNESAPLRLM